MDLNKFIEKNYPRLEEVCLNIAKKDADLASELLQSCVLQVLESNNLEDDMDEEVLFYYFVKVFKVNFHSSTSPFRYKSRKYSEKISLVDNFFDEVLLIDEEENLPYPDMEWIECELMNLHWFKRDLFLLYTEMGTLMKVHNKTTIPYNSISKTIKEVKIYLNNRWKSQQSQ